MLNIVLMGIQGSGKGTQAKRLSKRLGITHINVGNLLRNHIANKTEIGLFVKKYTRAGMLVPDNYIINIIKKLVAENSHGVVFDGFPRTMEQAKYLVENLKIDFVFLFDLPDEICYERIISRRVCESCKEDFNILHKSTKGIEICDKCGGRLVKRKDDYNEAIKKRIDAYHSETKPTLKFFKEKKLLYTIDAQLQPEMIHLKILEIIKNNV